MGSLKQSTKVQFETTKLGKLKKLRGATQILTWDK